MKIYEPGFSMQWQHLLRRTLVGSKQVAAIGIQ
ncbi:hypothetical protein BH10BAC2_BH10BAC2_48400 [soil metagenome]